jgi:hypothetical protein
VRRADTGSGDDSPPHVIPEVVEVGEYHVESEREVPADVLEDHELGPEVANRANHVGPDVPMVVQSPAPACR